MSCAVSSMTDTFFSDEWDDGLDYNLEALHLCGRETETARLLDAYKASNQSKKVVLLHGVSGSGKTSLVNALRDNVCDDGGHMCVGKYFQNQQTQEPYSVVMAAFSDLCEMISQSNDFQTRRASIQESLGIHGSVLLRSVSSLSPFLHNHVEEVPMQNDLAFGVACKTFLHSMASPTHPVVLVLDDIQWMDAGSRQLIEILLEDDTMQNIMLVFVYRNEEVDKIGAIFQTPKADEYVDVALENLDVKGVHDMMASFLSSYIPPAMSCLGHTRTRGNPFFVIQFLEMLQQEGLLTPDEHSEAWHFDVEKIQLNTMLPDTVAGVLLRKIERLPQSMQEVLQVASYLGYRFHEAMIAHVIDAMRGSKDQTIVTYDDSKSSGKPLIQTIKSCLDEAIKIGLIEKTSQEHQFSHDKIQAAFQAMISETEEDYLHWVIGRSFRTKKDAESNYQAAVHLNTARLILKPVETTELAQINYDAARYCHDKAAFLSTLPLLKEALQCLPSNEMWQSHYALSLGIMKLLAKTELTLGNFEESKSTIEIVLRNTKERKDIADFLVLRADVWFTQIDLLAFLQVSREGLRTLGVDLPARIGARHVIFKIAIVRRLLKNMKNEDILSLPVLTDKVSEAMVTLLSKAALGALLIHKSQDAGLFALEAVRISLTHGLTPYSSHAFALYSVIEFSLGNRNRGWKFAELTISVVDYFSYRQFQFDAGMPIMIATFFVSIWTLDQEMVCHLMDRALRNTLASGIENPSLIASVWSHSVYGEHLKTLEHRCATLHDHWCDFRQHRFCQMIKPLYQAVLNLQTQDVVNWNELFLLTGNRSFEATLLGDEEVTRGMATVEVDLLWSQKLQMAYHFRFLPVCVQLLKKMKPTLTKESPTFPDYFLGHFYACLIYYELYGLNGNRRNLRIVRKHLRALKAFRCPIAEPYFALLSAEAFAKSFRSKPADIIIYYDSAIEVAAEFNYNHLEALINERAGAVLFGCKSNQRTKVRAYLERAVTVYRDDWGAHAKAEWLERRVESMYPLDETARSDRVLGTVVG